MTSTEIKISKKFENGIFFSCEMCGTCCRGLGEGEVFLYKNDIKTLANHLNLKGKSGLREFTKKYLKIINDTFFWRNPKTKKGKTYRFKTLGFKFTGNDEHCHFLKDNKCTVHKARPFQCRAFPIGWNILINSLRNFKDYSKKCPALQKSLENQGYFYSKDEIIKWAKQEYEMEKNFFMKMKKNDFNIFKVYKFLPNDISNS
ncbi:MAG: YkgJ family cysteine cluster protein [Candidatus Lokiarchaeota archaeon]|nr:YkgJ family cysteine cluster protein [Candidatus Lokiarchaeota archaeon]